SVMRITRKQATAPRPLVPLSTKLVEDQKSRVSPRAAVECASSAQPAAAVAIPDRKRRAEEHQSHHVGVRPAAQHSEFGKLQVHAVDARDQSRRQQCYARDRKDLDDLVLLML